uniref:Uncharacterized protein n=1 Tax=Noctiluca scintillans TaxID=2966 RepID=A0A7S1ABM3_NOCSC|mmetsp:Transcript_39657/g.105055  ORF Transcript_39657/g.105055 Transcript_39657/m.105055 type:complete len:133 (+) Transcript_39657:72-470(+)
MNMQLERGSASPSPSGKPTFLQPAFDMKPVEPSPEGPPDMPPTPMASPSSRPPSSSGERSQALSQGFLRVSEIEATQKLNAALEQDNATLEMELAQFLRLNLQLRDNIEVMEKMLDVDPSDSILSGMSRGET